MSLIAGILFNSNSLNFTEMEKNFISMTETMQHRGKFTVSDSRGDKYHITQKSLKNYILHFDSIEIVFDGCIYNLSEVVEELKLKFQDVPVFVCEEEVIVFCYKKFGIDCLNLFEGKWAFCLIDKLANIVIFSRDRFGLKPLYYCNIDSNLYFASEIKAFTKIKGFKTIANIPRIFDFLVYQEMSFCEETMFKNVFQVLHGQNLVLNLKDFSIEKNKWYNLSENKNYLDSKINSSVRTSMPQSSFIKQSAGQTEDSELDNVAQQIMFFRKLLDEAVESRYFYNKKTASCLSGGIDSSAIVCSLFENKKIESISTVSACFDDEKYGEEKYIDAVVKKLGLNSNKITPNFDELIDNLDKYVYNHDEPFLTTSIFSQIKVFECAKNNGFDALLDGQGADEFLAGYTPFTHVLYFLELKKQRRFEKLEREKSEFIKKYKYAGNLDKILKKYTLLNILPNFLYRSLKEKSNLKNAPYITKLCINDKKYSKINVKNYSIKKFSKFMLDYSSMRKEFQYEDRSSMYSSVEFHSPFSSHKIIEYLFQLSNDLKIHEGVAKFILREAVKETMPQEIYTRYSKIGFETPEGKWIKNNSQKFRELLISSLSYIQKIVDLEKVIDWYDRTLLQGKEFNHEFWKLVCLGQWAKVYNVEF